MPAYELRFRVPATVPARKARTTFYWAPAPPSSFVARLGRRQLGPSLGSLGPVPALNVDFARLAALAYAADRSTPRPAEGSNWSRRYLDLIVPVSDADPWTSIQGELETLLAFLSGDDWRLEFKSSRAPKERVADPSSEPVRALLLSGGADSACGALLSRHELGEKRAHVLVSHFGPTFLPDIQRDVAARVATLLPGPEQVHNQINFTRRKRQTNGARFGNEYSTRARSLLFLALGLASASVHHVPLWVPENGFASLNPPLGPDRRGSLSTRTTHPAFLGGLSATLTKIGVHADLSNPFEGMTKGEMFMRASDLLGRGKAATFLSATHSCAHTGQRSLGLPVRFQCGVCFGCIVRRAAFKSSGLKDKTEYLMNMTHPGLAEFVSEKSVERAVEVFVAQGVRPVDIATLNLPPSYPPGEALDLCKRQLKELRTVIG